MPIAASASRTASRGALALDLVPYRGHHGDAHPPHHGIIATHWRFGSTQCSSFSSSSSPSSYDPSSASSSAAGWQLYAAEHSASTSGAAQLVRATAPLRLDSLATRARSTAVGTSHRLSAPPHSKVTDAIDCLRAFHPHLDVPATLIAQVVADDHQDHDRAHLDAHHAESLAVLRRPGELVICSIAGPNANQLLVSTLALPTHASDGDDAHPTIRSPAAHAISFSSPILQIVTAPLDAADKPSSNSSSSSTTTANAGSTSAAPGSASTTSRYAGPWIAVRTATEVWFGALAPAKPKRPSFPPPNYAFHPIDRLPRQGGAPLQYQDVRFDPTSKLRAWLVDGRGNLSVWHVPVDAKLRPRPRNASIHSLELSHQEASDVKGKGKTKAADDAGPGFWKLAPGPDGDSLYVASATCLYRVQLPPRNGADRRAVRRRCYTTKLASDALSRSLFTSLCSAPACEGGSAPLLAASTTAELIWFSAHDASMPLFTVRHHRGPDRSLCLAPLPSEDADRGAARFVLSSKRNRLLTVYSVSLAPTAEAKLNPEAEAPSTAAAKTVAGAALIAQRPLVFQHYPTWLPSSLPSGETPSSRPVLVRLSPLHNSHPWLRDNKLDYQLFEMTDRGAVWTRFLSTKKPDAGNPLPPPLPSFSSLSLSSSPFPSLEQGRQQQRQQQQQERKSALRIVEANDAPAHNEGVADWIEHPGSFGLVETRMLDLRNIYNAAITDTLNRSLRLPPGYRETLVARLERLADRLPELAVGRTATLATLLASAGRFGDAAATVGTDQRPKSLHFIADAPRRRDLMADGSLSERLDEVFRRVDEDAHCIDLVPVLWQLFRLRDLPPAGDEAGEALESALRATLLERYSPGQSGDAAAASPPPQWTQEQWQIYERSAMLARDELVFDIEAAAKVVVPRRPSGGGPAVGGGRTVAAVGYERRSTNWTYMDEEAYNQRYRSARPHPPPPQGPGEVAFGFLAPRKRRLGDGAGGPASQRRAAMVARNNDKDHAYGGGGTTTTTTTRLLLYEWELGSATSTYTYHDAYHDLLLPPESRSRSMTPASSVGVGGSHTPSRSNTPRLFSASTPSAAAAGGVGPSISQRHAPPTIASSQTSRRPPTIAMSQSQTQPQSHANTPTRRSRLASQEQKPFPLAATPAPASVSAYAAGQSQGLATTASLSSPAQATATAAASGQAAQSQAEPKPKKAKKRAKGF
ncbi:hypothetical protein ACQY0O_005322 [Thecaphora frezii]